MVWTRRTQTIAAAAITLSIVAIVIAATARTRPASSSAPAFKAAELAKSTPDYLWIPRLNIAAPIQYVTEAREDVFQRALRDGVVHFPGTAKPGEPGNVYLFGHSSDYSWSKGKFKTIFRALPNILLGDEIIVTDGAGSAFVYIVTDTKVVAPQDVSVLQQSDLTKKFLTLQTSYPIGTALKRYIVIAELR